MSTPPDKPGFGQDIPFQPVIPGMEAGTEDLVAKARAAADVTQTVNNMTEGTGALLQTLNTHLTSLKSTVDDLRPAFAATADHIKRGADYAEQLAKATKETEHSNKRNADYTKNAKFSVIDMVKALSKGDIGGAIGEAFQGFGSFGGPGGTAMAKANARMSTLGKGSFIERMMGKGSGFEGPVTEAGVGAAAPGLMARLGIAGGAGGLAALGELATPAAIFGAYKLLGQGIGAEQQARRIGALTGEGRGAGIAATGISIPILGNIGGEVGALRGFNPFDLIGNKEAMQIVMGVRGAGFRGGQARSIEETIKSIVNDVGVGVEDAMNVAIPAIKDANFSTSQLKDTMDSLKQTAHDSTISITDLTKSLGDLIAERAQTTRYGAAIAPAQRTALFAEFKGTPFGKDTSAINSILSTQTITGVALYSGISPLDITGKSFLDNYLNYYNKYILDLATQNDDGTGHTIWPWTEYVARLLMIPTIAQTFTMAPEKFADQLRTAWAKSKGGKNPGAFLNPLKLANKVGLAKASFNPQISDVQSQLNKLDSLIPQKILKERFDTKLPLLNNVSGWDGKLLTRTDQIIRAQNLGPQVRAELEAPLRKAIQSGNSWDIQNALSHLGDRITKAMTNSTHNVKISIDPRTGRYIRATVNSKSDAAARGEIGQQSTVHLFP